MNDTMTVASDRSSRTLHLLISVLPLLAVCVPSQIVEPEGLKVESDSDKVC